EVIVGIASYGKATYESEYNGGIGSNGLTSARHDVFMKQYANKFPEPYDNATSTEQVYSGNDRVTMSVPCVEVDAGKLVLSPTRTYASVMIQVLNEMRQHIHGIVHCSGGAQTKVMHFIDNLHVVKDNLFPVPPLFRLIQGQSGTDWKEMYKVFNMGHRLELYLPEKYANQVINIARTFNIDAQVIGRVESSAAKKVTIRSESGEFVYQ